MSVQSARDFLTKLSTDEDFRKGLGGCKTRAEQQQFALTSGFEFNAEEIRTASAEVQDAELDVIGGGKCGCGYTCENDCGNPGQACQ